MKQQLVDIANDTLETVKKGGYLYKNKFIKLNEPQTGILYPANYFDKNNLVPNKSNKKVPIFIVENKPVVDRIFEEKNNDICVLNFASAKHPGGGFLKGSMAQEESMAYCSDLFYTLCDTRLYELNKESKSKYYTDNMILSDVTFFKNSKFMLVDKPKTIKVITSSAVNMNLVPNTNADTEKAKLVMKNRMRKVLQLAIKSGCKTLVLGAFGCGVFRNKYEDISKYWHELLIEENFQIYFDIVYFTIYDRDHANLKHFEKYFK